MILFGLTTLFANCVIVRAEPEPRQIDGRNTQEGRNRMEMIEVVLTSEGDLRVGATRPPPQRLRIPMRYLSGLSAQLPRENGIVHSASGLSLDIPYAEDRFDLSPSSDAPAAQLAIGMTTTGYQERAISFTDPDVTHTSKYVALDPLPSGLQPIVSRDPAARNGFETRYMRRDAELGFVIGKCLGSVREPTVRRCRVTAQLNEFLTLTVFLEESELQAWRPLLVAAKTYLQTCLVKIN